MPCSGHAIGPWITQIFEDEARSKAALYSKEPREELASALVELRASLNSPVLWARPVSDELVEVWALAKASRPRGGQASRGFALRHGGLRPGERWASPRYLRPGRDWHCGDQLGPLEAVAAPSEDPTGLGNYPPITFNASATQRKNNTSVGVELTNLGPKGP